MTDTATDRRAPRPGLDETHLGQPLRHLVDRRAADVEPACELEVAQLLARREGPVHDRVAEPVEDVVAQH